MENKEATLQHYQEVLKEAQESWLATPVGQICLLAYRSQEQWVEK